LLAFALGWWGNDDLGNRKAAAVPAPEWVLPKPITSDVSGFAKILAEKAPFGTPAEQAKQAPDQLRIAAPGNAAAPQWRVGGIVTSETSRYLIVLIRRPGENTTRTEIRNPGAELTDGR